MTVSIPNGNSLNKAVMEYIKRIAQKELSDSFEKYWEEHKKEVYEKIGVAVAIELSAITNEVMLQNMNINININNHGVTK